jgi:hypothetical protein
LLDLTTRCDPSKVGMSIDNAEKVPRFPSYGSWVRSPSPAPIFQELGAELHLRRAGLGRVAQEIDWIEPGEAGVRS